MLILFLGIIYYNYEASMTALINIYNDKVDENVKIKYGHEVCNKYFICKGEKNQMRKTNEILIRNYYDDEEDLVLVEHKILKFHLRGKLYNRYN